MKTTANSRLWLAVMISSVMASAGLGRTIYVDAGAGGANNGSTWGHAFRYLQDALACASGGDEILVAAGVYRPDRGAGIVPGDQEASFILKDWVGLYGGYAGSSSPRNPGLRNVAAYRTALSGDLAGNDVPVTDTDALREESQRSRAENCYNVLVGDRVGASSVLDGFTITGGNARRGIASYRAHNGGGIYNGSGHLTIHNCTFIANYAESDGGAVYNSGSPILKGCSFQINAAGYDGGAVYNEGAQTRPVLIDCLFKDNRAGRWGGGIHNALDASPKVVNCLFTGNRAWKGGGFSHGNGGYYELTNCTFAGNVAEIGNAIAFDEKSSCGMVAQVVNCILRDGGQEIVTGEHCCIEVTHSNIEGGWPGEGNIEDEPIFVDPAGDDYRLARTSPCINAGDTSALPQSVTTDFCGNPRILDGVVDMGAYECQGPRTIYVDADAVGANDGSSWADAFNHLQDALGASAYGDQIRVAQGTYKPDRGVGLTAGDRQASFELKDGVMLRGGYAGFDESEPDARDIALYETILSGDLQGNDTVVCDPCELFDEPSRADNSYHVVTSSKVSATAVLDGLVISGGNADGSTPLSFNSDGGGMLNFQGDCTLVNITFRHNCAEGEYAWGGGMYSSGDPNLLNCRFIGNVAYGTEAGSGGGMYSYGKLTMVGCLFEDNIARAGGGLCAGVLPILTGCVFRSNSAMILGPDTSGVESGGGGMYAGYCRGRPMLKECVFVDNSGQMGGALRTYENEMIIQNCLFARNEAIGNGGGILSDTFPCSVELLNCTFGHNSAGGLGGAFLAGLEATPRILNCIMWGNTASDGAQITIYREGITRVDYSDIQGGKEGVLIYEHGEGSEALSWGVGNFDVDTCFVDPNQWDYHLRSERGRYWPEHGVWLVDEVTSPCIDAGDPAVSPGDETLPNGGRINMGAYGGTPEASRSERQWLIGDINHDGVVDMLDFGLLADNWLNRQDTPPEPGY
jgi:hypothetical protein